MPAHTTGFYLGVLALMYFWLTAFVILGRWKFRVGIGHGDHPEMLKRIRIHGNFIEYVPIVVLMMLCLDLSGAAPTRVHLLGILLLLGRSFHIAGVLQSTGTSLWRTLGMVLTFASLLLGATSLIFQQAMLWGI